VKGRIIGISGPTATIDLEGLRLYDRVQLGHSRIHGEVVRLELAGAVVQVYEDTRGLGLGEPVISLATPLTVQLGPGMLGSIYDGLQRPLDVLYEQYGPFISPGTYQPPLSPDKLYPFQPLKKKGDTVKRGEIIGTVTEGNFTHDILAPESGIIDRISQNDFTMEEPLGEMADGSPIQAVHAWPVRKPRPFKKKIPPREPLITGQRAIDFLFPIARGGTAIIPGGFGTGKTILEQAIAKFADVDVVVYVGCGERGNEMAEMLGEFAGLSDPWTGRSLRERTIMIANTSNMPVAAREASIYTAVTIAEYFRDQGNHVLLLADSISRWAEALREISSSLEEMPGEEGYPTYLSSRLSTFFSRAGVVETMSGATGSLTMILSVSPPGGDITEPATQACLRTSGVFLMLDTSLANRRHFPAINWFQSFSLYEKDIASYFTEHVSPHWEELRQDCQTLLQREEKLREVAEIVGAEGLQDCDHLVMYIAEKIRRQFLGQNSFSDDAFSPPEKTVERIDALVLQFENARTRIEQGDAFEDIIREMEP